MYYNHFLTSIFDYVDKFIQIELINPSQMHTKNLRIMRSLELQKIRMVHLVLYIVNSILFPLRKPRPIITITFNDVRIIPNAS